MMTIDNLPTQLPQDASEYFGDALYPLLSEYIGDNNADTLKGAAITENGRIIPKFRDELQPLIDKISAKKILVIGAGMVSKPVIEYLVQFQEYSITIAAPSFTGLSPIMENLEGLKNISFIKQEIRENGRLGKIDSAIQEADLVISLLPAVMHGLILESVFMHKKHLVTASYNSSEMESYAARVKQEGLLWLNEVGLDPGLDHMSAMKIISDIKESGSRLESFISWCGGLPAPEHADNPLGYKFSWSPLGALRAIQNPAKFLQDGQEINLMGSELLASSRPVNLHPAFSFEGLPNRDSLKYLSLYGLSGTGLKTMFRGTLRFSGFSEFMQGISALGFLDQKSLVMASFSNWKEAIKDALQVTIDNTLDWVQSLKRKLPTWSDEKCQTFLNNLNAMGLLDEGTQFDQRPTKLESFCSLLQSKLCYGPGERDMVFMHHEFIVKSNTNDKKQIITSTLCMFGNGNNSAMSLTVGLPVAVAARLILNGEIKDTGVVIPTTPSIYNPMLKELRQLGIRFTEKRLDCV